MISAVSMNLKGEGKEKVKLSDALFGVEPKTSVMSQAVRVYLSNQRTAHAKTKTRTEVSKTTAKMYKQKGTGRARHGSYAAPIFVGGGISHGPTGTQNYKLTLNSKVGRLSLIQALSLKAKSQDITILSGKTDGSIKTKDAQEYLNNLESKGNFLVVASSTEKNITRAFKNIKNVEITLPGQLNTYSILNSTKILFTKVSLEETEKLFTPKTK